MSKFLISLWVTSSMSLFVSLRRAAAVCAIFWGASSVAEKARAADFIVTNTSDSGAGSLRQAVADANGSPDDDTISFSLDKGAQVIELTSGELTFANNGRLSITGPNAEVGTVTISGNKSSRIGTIASRADLTLSQLTIANGLCSGTGFSNLGGALFNNGALIINGCTFSNNSTSAGGSSGVLFNYRGTIVINDSTFRDNTALFFDAGGSGYGGSGAVIGSSSDGVHIPRITISNSVFTENSAYSGGILYNLASCELTISNSTFTNNTAKGAGGCFSNGGVLTVSACTFAGNNAYDGGVLENYYNSGAQQATFRNCTFSNNRAQNNGGVIYNIDSSGGGSTATVENCTLASNQASEGGAIFNAPGSTLTMNSSIVAKNSARRGPDVSGTIAQGDYNLIGNRAGAILSGTHNITGRDPQLGELADNGGPTQTLLPLAGSPAIDAGNSTLDTDQRGVIRPLDNASVANAEGGNGSDIGAVEADAAQSGPRPVVNTTDDHDDGTCGVRDCTLHEAMNAANQSRDGGIVTFDLTVFASKTTLELTSPLPAITNFIGLFGPSTAGAGVTLHNKSASADTLVVSGGLLSLGNIAVTGAQGKGLVISKGRAIVIGCTFADNGIGIQNAGILQMNNSTIAGSADTGIYNGGTADEAVTVMESCTLTDNAQGIYIQKGQVGLANSLVVGNVTNIAGAGTLLDHGFNLMTGDSQAAGLDPRGLRNNGGPTPTIALLPGGSAVDAGQTNLETDQRGVVRPQRSAPDIGAFERVNSVPQITYLQITPLEPRTDDPLTANVLALDAELDTLTYTYTWIRTRAGKTSVLKTTETTKTTDTLPTVGSAVVAGDVIAVTVVVSDGFSATLPQTVRVTIANSPVLVSRIVLKPTTPRTGDVIVGDVQSSDADGGRPTYTFVWKKTHVGKTTTILTTKINGSQDKYDLSKPTYGNKGDVITLTVTASDGASSDTKSASVTVGNTMPTVASVTLAPTAPMPTGRVRATVTGSDIDATEHIDTLSYTFKWRVGTRLLSSETGSAIDLSKYPFVKMGDTVSVEVRAFDGTALSASKTASVKVGSSPGTATTSASNS